MLVPLPQGYSVVVNEKARSARRRFSIAHELGHIALLSSESFLPASKNSLQYRAEGKEADKRKDEERLCDEIAAEILMPEQFFKEKVETMGRSLENLPKWANSFGSSLTATAVRYSELLPEPCHLIKWVKSFHRKRVISPAWQRRNRVQGPSLLPVGELSQLGSFRAIQESWTTLRNYRSLESLLVRYWKGNRAYLDATTFETESLGFGGPGNRTVLSLVYLGRSF